MIYKVNVETGSLEARCINIKEAAPCIEKSILKVGRERYGSLFNFRTNAGYNFISHIIDRKKVTRSNIFLWPH